jgi:choline transport protein
LLIFRFLFANTVVGWITGWINVAGWIALTASGGLLGSQLILGVVSLMHPDYEPQRWQQFLIYIGYNIAAFLINAFMTRLLPLITRSAFIWSIVGFVVISITILACASPNYSSASFVFTDFINETGWPDGIAWLLGLLQAGLGLTGFDAVAHSRSNCSLSTSYRNYTDKVYSDRRNT